MPTTETTTQQLLQQVEWYRTLFHKAPDALLILQPHTWTILEANEQAHRLLDAQDDELIGSTFPFIRRSYKLLRQTNAPVVLDEAIVEQPRRRRTLILEVALCSEFIGDQEILIVAARDISEQRELTEKMIQTDKLALLGKLAGGVAHEIRNPLAAMSLHLQSLLRRFPRNTPEHRQIQAILEGVQRIDAIVQNTLSFSRAVPPNMQLQPIEPIIRDAVALLRPSLHRTKLISLDVEIEPDLPPLLVDAQQLEQVLLNLLSNAVEAITSKGTITLRARKISELRGSSLHQQMVEIQISDTGKGIAPEDLSKIFMPFFTRKPTGTGLGLSITQRIILEHGGTIEVDSQLNKGTTFYVKLPVPGQAKQE